MADKVTVYKVVLCDGRALVSWYIPRHGPVEAWFRVYRKPNGHKPVVPSAFAFDDMAAAIAYDGRQPNRQVWECEAETAQPIERIADFNPTSFSRFEKRLFTRGGLPADDHAVFCTNLRLVKRVWPT